MRFAVFIVTLAAIAIATAGVAFAEDETEPLSPAQEQIVGNKLREAFLEEHQLTQDGNLWLRVEEIGRRVVQSGDRPDLTYHFLVIAGERIQAYSIPGGTILVTEAMARLLDDDELAFVQGHEIAHLALRHHAFNLRLRDALEGTPKKVRRLLERLQHHFDRQSELEADKYGALYAMRARFRFSASQTALEKLRASGGPERDEAHPEYARRIALLQSYRALLEKALEAFELGLDALKRGDSIEAIRFLDIFVAEFPSNVPGRVNRGAAYLARVRSTGGTPANLAEVLPILPESGLKLRHGAYDPRDLESARRDFEQALRIRPDAAMPRAGLALVSIRTGDLNQARRQLQQARISDPQSVEILLCLGNVEYLLGNYEVAERLDLEVLSLRPQWPPALNNLALTYQQLDRLDEAYSLWSGLAEQGAVGRKMMERLNQLEAAPED